MDENYKKYFEINKETWNKKVSIHSVSEFYNVNGFLKGETSLNKIEIDEVGEVNGKSLLHLQCHFGLDTLSWSRLGANCTGVDFSNKAIEKAIQLNTNLNLNATFIESNVYDINKTVVGEFDIVFASYGVIGWLPDLEKWSQLIASKLKKGGCFYLVEFHPIVWMFNYKESPPKMMYSYLEGEVIYEEYKGTYTNKEADIISKEFGWNHSLGEVINSLINAGLEIEFLHEFEESPYNSFPDMEKTKNGMFVLKENSRLFPLLFSVKAIKK